MGFFSRIGNKGYSALKSGTRMGVKAMGTANRIGNKIASVGNAVVSTIEASPFGARLSKPLAIAKTGIGLIQGGANIAGKISGALQQVDSVASVGEKAIQSSMERRRPKGGSGQVAHDLGAGLQQQGISSRDVGLGSDMPRMRRGGRQ